VQQRFFQIIQRGELAPVGGFEASVVVRGVFMGRLDVVDRTGTDDDEQARVLAVEDAPHRPRPSSTVVCALSVSGNALFTCCGVGSRSCERTFRLLTGHWLWEMPEKAGKFNAEYA